jgi:hypothetical protein
MPLAGSECTPDFCLGRCLPSRQGSPGDLYCPVAKVNGRRSVDWADPILRTTLMESCYFAPFYTAPLGSWPLHSLHSLHTWLLEPDSLSACLYLGQLTRPVTVKKVLQQHCPPTPRHGRWSAGCQMSPALPRGAPTEDRSPSECTDL